MKSDPIKQNQRSDLETGANVTTTVDSIPPATVLPPPTNEGANDSLHASVTDSIRTPQTAPFLLPELNQEAQPETQEPKAETAEPQTQEIQPPKGRIIGQSVGIGGKNAKGDVARVLSRLESMGIATCEETATAQTDEIVLGELIKRYQSRVFFTVSDGLIGAGGNTETKLIEGQTEKKVKKPKKAATPSQPEANTEGETEAGKPDQKPEISCTEEAQKIWQESPNTEMAAMVAASQIGHNPQLAIELLNVAGNSQKDNIAYHISTNLSDTQIQALPDSVKLGLMTAMVGGFMSPGELEEIKRLGNGKKNTPYQPGNENLAECEEEIEQETISSQDNHLQPPELKKDQKSIPLKLQEGEQWLIPPVIGQEDYITQAHPNLAVGAKILTRSQLFFGALSKYKPGGTLDIKNKANWPKHNSYNPDKPFKSYYEVEVSTHWLACHNACIFMAKKAGVEVIENNKSMNLEISKSHTKGKVAGKQIDEQLRNGSAVVIRTPYKKSTHSLLIVGKAKGTGGNFYVFFDPGRTGEKGYDINVNRLYETDKSIESRRKYPYNYRVKEVRKSIRK